MRVIHPEADIRQRVLEHGNGVSAYTRQRIGESYPAMQRLLAQLTVSQVAAYDVGCGAGFDTFAIAQYFDYVLATDISRSAIREAQTLKQAAQLNTIDFRAVDASTFQPAQAFSLVYCNLMSHSLSSRNNFLKLLATCVEPDGVLLYSEINEGYAPLEIHRAILKQDLAELVFRVQQVLSGFMGWKQFRFFMAGTAGTLLEAGGLSVTTADQSTWNGMVIHERLTARHVRQAEFSPKPSVGDYLQPISGYDDVCRQFETAIRQRQQGPFPAATRDSLYQLATQGSHRYSPFLLFLLMADLLNIRWSPLSWWETAPGFGRVARRLQRNNPNPTQPDWAELKALDETFLKTMRLRAGLEAGPLEN